MEAKSIIMALVAMIVPTLALNAQGTSEAAIASANSIVRVWTDKDMVVYNHDFRSAGQFILWSDGSHGSRVFDLPSADAEVMDFEIINDTVLFCGVYRNPLLPGAGTCGFVGKFEINGAFAGTSPVEYVLLMSWMPYPASSPDERIYIRNLKRMDVFIDSAFGAVACMIGDTYINSSSMYERVSVMSAYKMPTLQWNIYTTVPKDGRQIFTDIAVLGNMVVAAGNGLSKTHSITRAYHKTSDFPRNPYSAYMFDSIYTALHTPMDDVLVSKVNGNIMAMAQLNEHPGTILHVLEFDAATGIPSQYTDTRITDIQGCHISGCPWRIMGLRYSLINNTLHILEQGVLAGDLAISSLLWTFPLTYGGESTVYVQKMTGLTQTSLDVDIRDMAVTSGIVDATSQLDVHTFTPGGSINVLPSAPPVPYDKCTYNTEDHLATALIYINQSPVDNIWVSEYSMYNTFLPLVYDIKFNLRCE